MTAKDLLALIVTVVLVIAAALAIGWLLFYYQPHYTEVICQVTRTDSAVFINNSTTITITHTTIQNTTVWETITKGYTCP